MEPTEEQLKLPSEDRPWGCCYEHQSIVAQRVDPTTLQRLDLQIETGSGEGSDPGHGPGAIFADLDIGTLSETEEDSMGAIAAVGGELVPLYLRSVLPSGVPAGDYTLTFDDSKLDVWRDQARTTQVYSGDEFSPSGATVWVEATSVSDTPIIITAAVSDPYALGGRTSDSVMVLPIRMNVDKEKTAGDLFKYENSDDWRFSPDAKDIESNNTARNRVVLKLDLGEAMANKVVYLRSFDVDDPATDAVIDPNGDPGGDNRGTVVDKDGGFCNWPAASQNGYQGRLRRYGSTEAFAAEGAVIAVTVGADGIVRVELATSFAPGDSFRVVAAFDRTKLETLSPADVPTTGAIDAAKLPNAVISPTIHVWRYLHVESDWMECTTGDQLSASICSDPQVRPDVLYLTQVSGDVFSANNGLRGDVLVSGEGESAQNFRIIASSAAGIVLDTQVAPGSYHITDANTGVRTPVTIGASSALEGRVYEIPIQVTSCDPAQTPRSGDYGGRLLRANGLNYFIIDNTPYTLSLMEIYVYIPSSMPALTAGTAVAAYDDDWEAVGDDNPAARIQQDREVDFGLMQESFLEKTNIFAAACILPEFDLLGQYDGKITGATHLPTDQFQKIPRLYDALNPCQGSRSLETDLFWVAYVCSGYQPGDWEDYDKPWRYAPGTPDNAKERATVGQTAWDVQLGPDMSYGGNVSIVYLETIRDATVTSLKTLSGLAVNVIEQRVVVHEIAHQLIGGEGHINTAPDNAMYETANNVPLDKWYFAAPSIREMRGRVHSPGELQ